MIDATSYYTSYSVLDFSIRFHRFNTVAEDPSRSITLACKYGFQTHIIKEIKKTAFGEPVTLFGPMTMLMPMPTTTISKINGENTDTNVAVVFHDRHHGIYH